MSKKPKTNKIENADQMELFAGDGVSYDESLDLFGAHKTREQIKAEEKQRKKEERAALREEMKKRRRAARQEGTPAKKKDVIIVTAVVSGIVLLCALLLGYNVWLGGKNHAWEIDEDRGYILKTDANPEMSGEGPMADVLEVYYTHNDHMYLELVISNGTDQPIRIDAIDVQVFDNATDELIAGGKIVLDEELVILVSDIGYYEFYISPDHIFVEGDTPLPEVCSFDIIIDSTPTTIE